MSSLPPDGQWGISGEALEIKSALKEVYDDLVGKVGLFSSNYALFCTGLVYGLLHGKTHGTKPNAAFIKLFAISDPVSRDVIDLVYRLLDDGREKNEIWQQMLSIADGGVLALNDTYKSNKSLRIPHLVEEAAGLWEGRMGSLHNINRGKGG